MEDPKIIEVVSALTLHGYAEKALEILGRKVTYIDDGKNLQETKSPDDRDVALENLETKATKDQHAFLLSWGRKNFKFITTELLRQFPRGTNPVDAVYFVLQDAMEEVRAHRTLNKKDAWIIKQFRWRHGALLKSVRKELKAVGKWEAKWRKKTPRSEELKAFGVMRDRRNLLKHMEESFQKISQELKILQVS